MLHELAAWLDEFRTLNMDMKYVLINIKHYKQPMIYEIESTYKCSIFGTDSVKPYTAIAFGCGDVLYIGVFPKQKRRS